MDRDKRREFEADAYYELWRRGCNPDSLDIDRCEDAFYSGKYYDGYDYGAAEARRIAGLRAKQDGNDHEYDQEG